MCPAEHGSVVRRSAMEPCSFLPTKTGLWWRFAFRSGIGRPPLSMLLCGLGRVVLCCLSVFLLVFGR